MNSVNTFVDFLGVVIASTVGTAVLLAIAGFLGRQQIAHWLAKDLEQLKAEYQQQLEAAKAGHQRELESYKVSLIAEAERAKSTQEVKKAAALKIVELEFLALDRFHKAYVATRHAIPSFARLPAEYKVAAKCQEVTDKLNELSAAENGWDVFLSHEERQVTFGFRQMLYERCLPHLGAGAPPIEPATWAGIRDEIGAATSAVDQLIVAKLQAMRAT